MRSKIQKIKEIATSLNDNPKQWNYLSSIKYMLDSKLYVDSFCKDVQKVLEFVKNKRVKILDFGTGSGIFASSLFLLDNPDFKEIFAIDAVNHDTNNEISKDQIKNQTKLWDKLNSELVKVKFQQYDGAKIPFKDNTFDIVVAYAVIEHVGEENVERILKELKRVLKSDGLLFIFKTPRKFALTEHIAALLRIGSHEVLYSDKKIKDILAGHFSIVEHWKSDMVFEFPGKYTNLIYPILKNLGTMLYYSPFRIFAHHNNFILKK